MKIRTNREAMNIFYLNVDPLKCAQQHCNRHVVKMIVEYAQLLSTAHRVLDGKIEIRDGKNYYSHNVWDSKIYKATHVNHPCSKWVRESSQNYTWLLYLWKNLLDEYYYRYGRIHKSESLFPYLSQVPINSKTAKYVTQPPAVMPKEFIISEDNVINYRNYYQLGKTEILYYTKRKKPDWMEKKYGKHRTTY